MPPGPTRHRVAIVIALVGVAVSAYTWHVVSELEAGARFASALCRPGTAIDCETVLTSPWGRLLEVSVAAWGMAAFAAGALLALPGALRPGPGTVADLGLLGLSAGSLGFALVLLGIAVIGLRTVCLFCLAMDVVVVAWFVTVAPLTGRFAPAARDRAARRRTAQAALAGGLALALLGGTGWALYPAAGAQARTRAEVCAASPEFCRYWDAQPVVATGEVVGDARHARGDADAPVTIAEFSDFQCPACAAAYETLHELLKRRRDVRLVFRHYPLDSRCNPAMDRPVHPDACTAAAAADCAAQQGRFWEYHDLLFENQRAIDRDSMFRFARELQLDIPRFRTCLDDPATLTAVSRDAGDGTALGVESTPTLFINGRRLPGALGPPYLEYALVLAREEPRRGG